jgi:hypothetical protein
MATLATTIKDVRGDIEAIRTATGYNSEYLKHGSACDSSSSRERRMDVVLKAERDFVLDHQREILEIAARRLEDEMKDAKAVM